MNKFKKIKKSKYIDGFEIRDLYYKESNKFIKLGKKVDTFIKENYEFILQNRVKNELCDILDVLFERDNMHDFIKTKMLYTLSQATLLEWVKIFERKYDFDWNTFFSQNIDELLKIIDFKKIFELLKFVENLDGKVIAEFNDVLEKEKRNYVEYILFNKTLYTDDKNGEYSSLLDIVVLLIDELLKSENKRLIDIKPLSIGTYSEVIEIGTKIVKLGTRKLNEITYDERLLMPIIKFDFNKISSMDVIVEVTEKANNNLELSREDLYQIYLDMRRRGIICADMRSENVGILLKDNIPIFENKVFDNLKTKGILYTPKRRKILKTGEYVIIDLDYIYRENAVNIEWGNSMTREFERRYRDKEIESKEEKGFSYVKK